MFKNVTNIRKYLEFKKSLKLVTYTFKNKQPYLIFLLAERAHSKYVQSTLLCPLKRIENSLLEPIFITTCYEFLKSCSSYFS